MTAPARGFQVAGEVYDRFVGRYSPALAGRLCDLAGVGPGMRVLDVGCGPGALTAELARRGATVSAAEPSEPFAAACRERVPEADVRVASAESLPFAEGEFDALLSQLVVNFLSDAPQALREMRRVARPGAVVAAAVWDYGEGMVMLRAFWDAAVETTGDDGAARDESRVMPYCTSESLGGLWREAGLAGVRVEPVTVAARYDGFDDLWQPFTAGVGPAGSFTAALGEAGRERLREAYRRRLGEPVGPFELTARAWCAVGRS